MVDLPSNSALVRVGKALAARTETGDQLDQLDVLLAWCDDVQARATERLNQVLNPAGSTEPGIPTARGRAKTLITLREKLARMGGHSLPRIRDLAGLRIVGDLSLDEQDQLLPFACRVLGVGEADYKVIDRRAQPMQGYRALHAEFQLEGIRVELQIRTLLQHQWAEVYERAGDRFGRSIRYGTEDSDLEDAPEAKVKFAATFVDAMQAASRLIAELEETRRPYDAFKVDRVVADASAGETTSVDAILLAAEARRRQLSDILQQLGALLDQLDAREGGRL